MKLMRRLLGAAVFVAILVFGWRFAADHSGPVQVKLPGLAGIEVTLWMALLAAFGLGAVIVTVIASLRIARLQLVSRRYRKVIRDLEAEVHQLRNLPLAEETAAPAKLTAEAGEATSAGRALGRGA
jgi:uncharacterized integral membrane protein